MSQSPSTRFDSKIRGVQMCIQDLPLGTPADPYLFDRARGASQGILREIGAAFKGSKDEKHRQAVWLLYYALFFDADPDRFNLRAGNVNTMMTWDRSCFGHSFWSWIHRDDS